MPGMIPTLTTATASVTALKQHAQCDTTATTVRMRVHGMLTAYYNDNGQGSMQYNDNEGQGAIGCPVQPQPQPQ